MQLPGDYFLSQASRQSPGPDQECRKDFYLVVSSARRYQNKSHGLRILTSLQRQVLSPQILAERWSHA
jgi:hypothetical protein